ncbi:hypothetical protein LLG10_03575 [bacterium]|nr:hypothetical protein [bacterium]
MKEEYWKFLKKGLWIFGIGVLLMIASPMIWTLRSGWIDFSATGEIGDTIGGLTAPVIGVIGAALVFLSFMEQWKANRIQWTVMQENKLEEIKEKNFAIIWEQYKEIKNELHHPFLKKCLVSLKNNVKEIDWEKAIIELEPILLDFEYVVKMMIALKEKEIDHDRAHLLLHKLNSLMDELGWFYEDIPEDDDFLSHNKQQYWRFIPSYRKVCKKYSFPE